MSAARVRLLTAVSIAVGLAASTSHAQGQSEPPTVRDYCIKIAPGKAAEYEAYRRDKVHPNTTATEAFQRFDKARSIHDVEVYKVVEVVRGK